MKNNPKEKLLMEELTKKQQMSIHEATEYLKISQATARRLFTKLEEKGRLVRTHGGVRITERALIDYQFEDLTNRQIDEKMRIGKYAASTVESGDAIYLDSGTTLTFMAYELLKEAIVQAKEKSDIVVVSGGSSKGKKDMTAQLIDELTTPGVFTHGLALKPGKPTILGVNEEDKTLMAGLPGHPVAAMAVFEMLLVWLKRELTCEPEKGKVPAVLSGNVPGAPGRQTILFVELEQTEDGYLAKPIFGKSGLMSTITRADGYTTIEMLQEGLKSGEKVWVHTF